MNTVIGKTCPYCQTPIKPDLPVVVCSACGMPHHAECWQENGRCTTFGCNGDPSGGAASPPRPASPLPQRSAAGQLICPVCGYALSAFDTQCPRCANFRGRAPAAFPGRSASPYVRQAPRPIPPPPSVPQGYPTGYGYYLPAECPYELRRWNWGAFFITLFWTAAMNQWLWFVLCFVPVVNWIVPWIVALNGNEYAWKSRRWDNVQQFQATQRIWNNWGIALFVISIVFAIIGLVASTNN